MGNCRQHRIKDTVLFVLFVLGINWHDICLCNSLWRKLQSAAADNNYHLTLYICNCLIIVAAVELETLQVVFNNAADFNNAIAKSLLRNKIWWINIFKGPPVAPWKILKSNTQNIKARSEKNRHWIVTCISAKFGDLDFVQQNLIWSDVTDSAQVLYIYIFAYVTILIGPQWHWLDVINFIFI